MDLVSPCLVAHKPRSWVWLNGWVETRGDNDLKQIHCLYPGCSKSFRYVKGSTTNINDHLQRQHHLTKDVRNDGSFTIAKGPLERAMEKLNKRPAETGFSIIDFQRLLAKFLIQKRLPFTFVEDPIFQKLLHMAQLAPNKDVLALPSNDTMAKRVHYLRLVVFHFVQVPAYLLNDLFC